MQGPDDAIEASKHSKSSTDREHLLKLMLAAQRERQRSSYSISSRGP